MTDTWTGVIGRIDVGAAPPSAATLLTGLRDAVTRELDAFVGARCAEWRADGSAPEVLAEVLRDLLVGGKQLRSCFAGLGWLCGAAEDRAVARVGASIELVHAFALIQDDVMDGSAERRGRPAAHVRLARWYVASGRTGDAGRFGESAATLLADLCLVWAERLWRESGMDPQRLGRAWPRFDAMRCELAVGQLADLLNDAATSPPMARVLDIARRKSGDYTVRWPLEIGAALAGCPAPVLAAVSAYGTLVGEAFQLRDDLIGVLGDPRATGKPVGDDLRENKATTLVVLARDLADEAGRREMDALARAEGLGPQHLDRWRDLIVTSGAPERMEKMISHRVRRARARIVTAGVDPVVVAALEHLTHRHIAPAGTAPAQARR